MTVTPIRRTYWVVGSFICVLLVLLVVVPLALNHRTSELIAQINEQGDSSDRKNAEIQANLSHEFSGLLGFQETGQKKYSDLYFQAERNATTLVGQLREFAP